MTTAQYSIARGAEGRFENVWKITRDLLTQVNGFLRLDYHKGPEKDGKTIYFILTMWETEQNYLSWRGYDYCNTLQNRQETHNRQAFTRYNLHYIYEKPTKH